jgi:glutamate N-acetyltransferase/amino-acid N-acetyltransferase
MITAWGEVEAGITYPEGFAAAAVRAGLKRAGNDLCLIVSDRQAAAAGLFTTNVVQASCVRWSRQIAESGRALAIVCNAGNANACNGARGDVDNRRMAELVGSRLGVSAESVLTASTGIIGQPLPLDKVEAGVAQFAESVARSAEVDLEVARAMLTTDTRPKLKAVSIRSDRSDGFYKIGGVCKGSGMIAPNMATMLCFLTTDAQIPPDSLKQALSRAVKRTFNRMTVDGDTSTNDMILALANGASGVAVDSAGFDDFCEALERVCLYLAKEVARDGEGATKRVEITVRGAESEKAAERIGRTIAESPLVKTALFGCDPNWGRIMMAAGRAGIPFDPSRASVHIGEVQVFANGTSLPFDAKEASTYLSHKDVSIVLDLHSGNEQSTFWTCDYSYDYIKINAEYHT